MSWIRAKGRRLKEGGYGYKRVTRDACDGIVQYWTVAVGT